MPSERLPFKTITPAARPVDTYVRPEQRDVQGPQVVQAKTSDSLGTLAKSLSQINPALEKFTLNRLDEANKAAEARGQFLFGLAENKRKFNEALDELKVSDPDLFAEVSGANPHLRQGWNRAWLEHSAMTYYDRLDSDVSANPMITLEDGSTINAFESQDPGLMGRYMSDHLRSFMEEAGIAGMDPVEVTEVFMPMANRYQREWMHRNASERRKEMVQKRVEQLGVNTTTLLGRTLKTDEFQMASDATMRGLGERLTADIRAAYEDGVRDFPSLNREVADAVIQVARASGDTSILGVLDHIETGPGSTLGANPAVMEQVNALRDRLEDRSIARMNLQYTLERRQKEKILERVRSDVMGKLLAARDDPGIDAHSLDLLPDIQVLYDHDMGYEAEVLLQSQQRMISMERDVPNDPITLHELTVRVDGLNTNETEIDANFNAGLINESTRNRLTNDLQLNRRYQRDDFVGIVNGGAREVERYFSGGDGMSIPGDPDKAAMAKSAALEFKRRFRAEVRKVEREGGDRLLQDDLEILKDEVLTKILNSPRFRSPDTGSTSQPVTPDFNTGLDTPVFQDAEELAAHATEYNNTGGGPLADMAKRYGLTPEEFYAAQEKLILGE